MRVGILGTGVVGRAIGARLVELGHDVKIGTRNVSQTLARVEPDRMGNPPFKTWQQHNPKATLGAFTEAAAHGEIIVNATNGTASLEVLREAGEVNLAGKVLIDISNPLDFSKGMPPTLFMSNTDSMGEQIQRTFPRAKVVKTLNTVNAFLMVGPGQLAGADHTIFLSGNDVEAKTKVTDLLKTFGLEGYHRSGGHHDGPRCRDVSAAMAADVGRAPEADV